MLIAHTPRYPTICWALKNFYVCFIAMPMSVFIFCQLWACQ